MREYFMRTARLGFSRWRKEDLPLAELLWGEPAVTRYICASGLFADEDIARRLALELENGETHGVQYWPVFELSSGELVGCCGLRPRSPGVFELGFHLRSAFWGAGLATEAARAVIRHARETLDACELFAGHSPHNGASRKVLEKLGFAYTGSELYAPTGLMHPCYSCRLERKTSD